MTKRTFGRSSKQYCLICEKEIERMDKKFQIAVDRPIYLNIFLHQKCYKKTDEKSLENAVKRHIYSIL